MVAVAAEVAVSESNADISSNCNISGCTIPVNIMCVSVAICCCEHNSTDFLALLSCLGMACSNCLQQIVFKPFADTVVFQLSAIENLELFTTCRSAQLLLFLTL